MTDLIGDSLMILAIGLKMQKEIEIININNPSENNSFCDKLKRLKMFLSNSQFDGFSKFKEVISKIENNLEPKQSY